ncbi:glycosyltransferase family 4 protein [Clostridium folliculivorans]|uniref:glycosyltransferase family 4 protein n=1 Tax=Clostridium folliculivorans TaxID=2886038 RepID=UPI0021C4543A|nr:glycosyltransferase family 4 protein [Clostridium folliculivorans]GKU31660.1 glycosyl transferase [Clostridium folliculivorans]
MNIALVHEWLTNMAGSERVVINFKELYKDAPLYTTMYDPEKLDKELQDIDVRTSFLQKKVKKGHQRFLPFMPMAFESFDLNEYDVILSSSSSCAKGVVTNPNTMHVCYCHTPMRYAWEFYYEYADKTEMKKIKKTFLKYFMNYMRIWDRLAADRVDYFIANSENVAKRIWKHYRKESVVIHPPVRCKLFNIGEKDDDFFLILSRLVPYKRIDLAVKAFNELGLPLVIIGDGEERSKLEAIAKGNIQFLGRQPDEVIKEYYSRCRGFVFPGEEDFGITPLEAQSCGRPVIAYGKGGVLETVIEGETGVFFEEQTTESLVEAVRRFENMTFDKQAIRKHAETFDEEIFKQKIENFINDKYEEFKNTKHWKVIR